MAKQLITTNELMGSRVLGGKKGTRRIGKVRRLVFHPKEKRVIGFIVKRPDLLWMFRRKDVFVSLDGYDEVDGRLVVRNEGAATDRGACKALGVDWDSCVLWGGLPVMTEGGETLGTVGSVTFNRLTGAIDAIEADSGATANALLGVREIPASLIKGFRRGMGSALAYTSNESQEDDAVVYGAILVADEAKNITTEGGLAEQAGKATAVVADKAQTAVDKAKPVVSEAAKKTGEAVNKGAYTTGKQLSKTKTMFSDFKEEYDKERGVKDKKEIDALTVQDTDAVESPAGETVVDTTKQAPSTKKAEETASDGVSKAIGEHMGRAKGMFSAFKEEYDKARRDDQ